MADISNETGGEAVLESFLAENPSVLFIRLHWVDLSGMLHARLALIEEIVESLAEANIGVFHFHTELAHQLEIALEPLPPVQALDTLYYAIETIKSCAVRRGMRATISPKPLLDGTINGMHMHLSVSPKDYSEHFLAGILAHMQGLLVLGVANYDGYVRVGDRMDAFGSFVGYGTGNGEFPILKVEESHWELRFVDATANYYLLLAVVLSLGLAGIRDAEPLTWSDVRRRPHDLDANELRSLGITQRLPLSLKEGLDFLRSDSIFGDTLGKVMRDYYLAIKSKDRQAFEKMADEERRQWFIRYF